MKSRADDMTDAELAETLFGIWMGPSGTAKDSWLIVAQKTRALFTRKSTAELEQVRCDITRTAAVACASRPLEITYPQGQQQIAGDNPMHFAALDKLRDLLQRESELLSKAVQP